MLFGVFVVIRNLGCLVILVWLGCVGCWILTGCLLVCLLIAVCCFVVDCFDLSSFVFGFYDFVWGHRHCVAPFVMVGLLGCVICLYIGGLFIRVGLFVVLLCLHWFGFQFIFLLFVLVGVLCHLLFGFGL